MCEIKRIVFRKKYLLSILVLLLANLFLFQYFQMENLKLLQDENTRGSLKEEWKERQLAAKVEFKEKIARMSEEASQLSEISIFSNLDSFSNQNIWRTQEDFKTLKDVEIDTVHSDQAIQSFLEYKGTNFLLLIFVVFTVFAFFDERKSGLWQITYSCKKGRRQLAVKRLGFLAIGVILFSGLLILETLMIAFYDYGGEELLFSSVQSVIILQDFILPISLLEFLIYYWSISAGLMIVSGLFIWAILSLIHNRSMGIFLLVSIYGVELVLNYVIPVQHPLCILRYFNIFFFINPQEMFTFYTNFSVATYLVNLREFVQWVSLVLIVMLGLLVCYVNVKTRPFYLEGIVERMMKWFVECCKKALCHCNGICFEFYKLLIQGRGICVLAMFAFLVISGISDEELLVSPAKEQLYKFYEENVGEVKKDTMISYDNIKKELERIDNRYKNASPEDQKAARDTYESYEATRMMFGQLQKRLQYVEQLEKKGITGWWLNETGYCRLFGDENRMKRLVYGALSILAMVLTLIRCFAFENRSGVRFIIRCTPKGRKTFFMRKLVCAVFVAVFVTGFTVGAEIFEVGRMYSLQGLSAPVQNISLLEKCPISINIGQFLCVWILVRLFINIIIAGMCLMISSLSGRGETFLCRKGRTTDD